MRLAVVFLGVAVAAQVLLFLFSVEMSLRVADPSSALVVLHAAALVAFALGAWGMATSRAAAADLPRELPDFTAQIEARFVEWHLTPAERDVAWFTMKGLSINEIAALRGTSEGTVKAQGNAIYRKAGVAGRVQLLAAFMDELVLSGENRKGDASPPTEADAA